MDFPRYASHETAQQQCWHCCKEMTGVEKIRTHYPVGRWKIRCPHCGLYKFYDVNKFKEGDRVTREIDIFDPSKGTRSGTIQKKYSKPAEYLSLSKTTLGPYEELYEVVWDDNSVERGFLPHGLDPEKET